MILTPQEAKNMGTKCPRCGLQRDYSRITFISETKRDKQTFYRCGSILNLKQTSDGYKAKWDFNCAGIIEQ